MGLLEAPGLSLATARRFYERKGTADRSGLCIVLDDQWAEHYTLAMPAIEAAGGRTTFAFCSAFNDLAGHMTSAQVTAAAARGHEFAAHSSSHVDMTTLTPSQRRPQFDNPSDDLLALTGVRPTHFVYPSGARNATIDNEAYARYARTFWSPNVIPTRRGKRTPFAVARFGWSDTTQAAALDIVRQVAAEPITAVIYTHEIKISTGLTPTNFQAVIDLAVSLGVPLLTLSEAFTDHRPIPNRSQSDTTLSDNYTTTSSGSGLSSSSDGTVTLPSSFISVTGDRAIKIGSSSSAVASRLLESIYAQEVDGGRPFALPIWVQLAKTSGTGGLDVLLYEYDASGTLIRTTTLQSVTTDTAGAWAYYAPRIMLDARTAYVHHGFRLANAIGTAYFYNPWPSHCSENMIAPPEPETATYPDVVEISPYAEPSASSGTATFPVAAGYYNGGARQTVNAAEYTEWPVELQAGTYSVVLLSRKSTDSGVSDVTVDGVAVGSVDQYAGTAAGDRTRISTSLAIATSGRHLVRVTTNASKNASSSGFNSRVSGLVFTRTTDAAP